MLLPETQAVSSYRPFHQWYPRWKLALPGDFGGRRGLLNSDFWSDSSTQHGQLVTWRVDNEGSFLGHMRASDVRLDQLKMQLGDHFTMRLGVEPAAQYVSGMNLFGRGSRDFQQDIIIRFAHH